MLGEFEQPLPEINHQWNYTLPHPLINESNVEHTQTVNYKQIGRNKHSSRHARLTAGFANDVKLSNEEMREIALANVDDYHLSIPISSQEQYKKNRNDQSFRGLSPEAFAKITETLGAINTVGRYLVNFTRGSASPANLLISNAQNDQINGAVSKDYNLLATCAFLRLLIDFSIIDNSYYTLLALRTKVSSNLLYFRQR